jgi:gamma-glutamyltranspeptidase/glutathione hydrolase
MTEARSEAPSAFLAEAALAHLFEAVSACVLGGTPRGSTTHLSVIDAGGMAAGMTHSNGEGCGHVVPGTGIMMNNFLGEDDINPGGFHLQPAGEPILTMMCPTLVRRGARRWVLGSGGSNRIRTALLQVLQHLLDAGRSAPEAVEAPRMHVEGEVLNLEVTGRSAEEIAEAVALATHVVRFDGPNMFFGGVHTAELGPDGFGGAGDARRGGVVVLA